MNLPRSHIIISSASFIVALIFFALYNQWILFNAPWNTHYALSSSAIIQKKQITHHYFHGDKWKTEKQDVLWENSVEKNMYQLVNAWLTLLDEEHVIAKKTMLQSALISTAGCAYLSFDHNVLAKEDTIFKKWMFIEGLLKTLVVNGIAIHNVQFLVQHQALHDAHIDFSFPWPVHGFFSN